MIRYIIQGRYRGDRKWHGLMCLCLDGALLFYGGPPTLFRDYEQARNAIRRNIRYAKRHDITIWGLEGDYRIIRCEEVE